jgi:hypothetical protein
MDYATNPTGNVLPCMVMDAPPELRRLRAWIEDVSRPTVDIDAFYGQIFHCLTLAGQDALTDLHQFANDVGYGDALFGQHALLRHEQHAVAMLVVAAGEALYAELNTRCLYQDDGVFPYYFITCHGNGLLIFENFD